MKAVVTAALTLLMLTGAGLVAVPTTTSAPSVSADWHWKPGTSKPPCPAACE